jgi:hypothetical protein
MQQQQQQHGCCGCVDPGACERDAKLDPTRAVMPVATLMGEREPLELQQQNSESSLVLVVVLGLSRKKPVRANPL